MAAVGRIWLECEGKEMEEYGVTMELDKKGRPIKVCYVELVPDASFKVHWSYDAQVDKMSGARVRIWVDGTISDHYLRRFTVPATRRDCNQGFRTSSSSLRPYKFQPCLLSDESLEKGDGETSSIRCMIKPFQALPLASAPSSSTWQTPTQTTYNPDSKPAVLGYSVGPGVETADRKRGERDYDARDIPGAPILAASFRYRTREQLLAQGFIKGTDVDIPERGQAPDEVVEATNTAKTEQGADAGIVRNKRMRELEEELARLRGEEAASVERDVKPKRMRIDASGNEGAKSPIKISIDLTGDDDDDDDGDE